MSMRIICASGFAAVSLASAANATVLFEDVIYWRPNGQSVINPQTPPTDAYVKIQETVFDDAQGRALLGAQQGIGAINGPAIPAVTIDVYAYSITNLNYGNGPFVGGGAGVSGFNINGMVPALGMWGPVAANNAWEPGSGNSLPTDFNWDIDANGDTFNGDGSGILLGRRSIACTSRWQPGSSPIDVITGLVSGPVPTPGGAALLGLGGLCTARRRR